MICLEEHSVVVQVVVGDQLLTYFLSTLCQLLVTGQQQTETTGTLAHTIDFKRNEKITSS
jgi:hypothetical protein